MHLDDESIAEKVRILLKKLVAMPSLAHLYIFTSPDERKASDVAKKFLLDWLSVSSLNHPDLFELSCSGKMGVHTVSRIRDLLEDFTLTTSSGRGRAILIHAAERMLPAASNTLLKALEEPPPKTCIILATHSFQKILPTIISRAQVIRIPCEAAPMAAVPRFTSYSDVCAYTADLCASFEERRSSLEKELKQSRMLGTENLSAGARYEIEQEIEGELTLFSQQYAKKVIQDTYVALRFESSDPKGLTTSLLQSLHAIDKGSDLKRILPLFLSKTILLPIAL